MNIHTDTGTVGFALAEVDSITFELGGAGSVAQLRLADGDIGTWTEDSADGYFYYGDTGAPDSMSLYAIINGGAKPYYDSGLVEGFRQKLTNSSIPDEVKYVELYVMDFADAATATAMFIAKVPPNASALGSYDISAAAASSVLGGIKGYAHFGKFYIEISLTGYSDQNDARNEAVLFLNNFEGKI